MWTGNVRRWKIAKMIFARCQRSNVWRRWNEKINLVKMACFVIFPNELLAKLELPLNERLIFKDLLLNRSAMTNEGCHSGEKGFSAFELWLKKCLFLKMFCLSELRANVLFSHFNTIETSCEGSFWLDVRIQKSVFTQKIFKNCYFSKKSILFRFYIFK